MSLRLVALCVDANDPLGLARFWAEALRWEVADETVEEIRVVPTDGTKFRMDFMPVPEPKVGPNRLHLDLTARPWTTSGIRWPGSSSSARTTSTSGSDPTRGMSCWLIPRANEFCVIEPGNAFLADCGRLGSITCDGTREVGYF